MVDYCVADASVQTSWTPLKSEPARNGERDSLHSLFRRHLAASANRFATVFHGAEILLSMADEGKLSAINSTLVMAARELVDKQPSPYSWRDL